MISIGILVFSILIAFLYNVLSFYYSRFDAYDLNYIQTNMTEWIDNRINAENDVAKIQECSLIIQDNQCFVFFSYMPQKDNPIISEMTNEVVQRNIFYGYARVQKSFHEYTISDFSISNYDTYENRNYVSISGTLRDHNYISYGKILDERVDKIEFYDEDILVKTYLVNDNDYYFVLIDSMRGNAIQKYYDSNGLLLINE
ncbi:MAG: hypothetical protein LBM69_05705 [Lachnospiraceae bacterium]|nr:hypothetical protein [Lachnospiraceae bacterium]